LDRQTVEYRGVELQISQVSDLVVSEYHQAYALLYNELLLHARDLTPMELWRLKDDLDLEDFGGSWLSHPRNAFYLLSCLLQTSWLHWRVWDDSMKSTPRTLS
jgi:hypothetical protein